MVHAVEDVVAVPAPRDAVGAVQTQELVLSALLHAAGLWRERASTGFTPKHVKPRRWAQGLLKNDVSELD